MTDKIVDGLEQLTPLMDSAVKRMQSMHLTAGEHIALSFMTCAEFSIRAINALPQRSETLTEEQMMCILVLLAKKKRAADEVMRAAAEKFMGGGRIQ